jgi:hypothetical protein
VPASFTGEGNFFEPDLALGWGLSDLSGLWGVWHATTRAANGMEWAAARLMAGRRLTGRILEYAACVRHMAVGCAICLVARRREALQPTEDHTAKISASLIGQHPLSGTKAVRPICAAFTAYFRHPRFGRHGPQSTIAATPGIRLGSPSSARIRHGSTGCSEEAEADATIPSIASASSAERRLRPQAFPTLRLWGGCAMARRRRRVRGSMSGRNQEADTSPCLPSQITPWAENVGVMLQSEDNLGRLGGRPLVSGCEISFFGLGRAVRIRAGETVCCKANCLTHFGCNIPARGNLGRPDGRARLMRLGVQRPSALG